MTSKTSVRKKISTKIFMRHSSSKTKYQTRNMTSKIFFRTKSPTKLSVLPRTPCPKTIKGLLQTQVTLCRSLY